MHAYLVGELQRCQIEGMSMCLANGTINGKTLNDINVQWDLEDQLHHSLRVATQVE